MSEPKGEKNKEWFNDWFDTPYYHLLYCNRDEGEAEFFLDHLVAFLGIQAGDRVLDLPCGKGRHAAYLHKKGFYVEGADLSENSIRQANRMQTSGLSFRVHDIRMPYPLSGFDYVLNLFTSFGYFEREEENEQAFATLVHAMAPGASLVIDFMNTAKVIAAMVSSEQKEIGGIMFSLKRYLKEGFIYKEISFQDKGQSYLFKERVKELYPADFSSYFKRFGLKIRAEWGDYNLLPYDALNSDRYIVVAKKI